MSYSHGTGNYIIFSVALENLPDHVNQARHKSLLKYLNTNDITYVELQGKYEGIAEPSVIINAKHFDDVHHIIKDYKQECYMYLTPHRHGLRNVYLIPAEIPLSQAAAHDNSLILYCWFEGYLRSVPEEVALQAKGYSYRPDLDTYWIVCDSDSTQTMSCVA